MSVATMAVRPAGARRLAALAWRHVLAMGLIYLDCASAQTATSPPALALSPPAFSGMAIGEVGPGWRFAGLPSQKIPQTRFDVLEQGGKRVLRVQADASYGTLLWNAGGARLEPGAMLRWSWQLERGLPNSDLSRKGGDDSPIKVCALFDMPLDGLPFGERAKLRLARALSGEALPSATLCYVWDRLLPEGTLIANPHSARVRFIIVSSGAARPGQWIAQERNLTQDFMRAFGAEAASVPPLVALAVGADADSTQGSSLAYVGDLMLAP